MTPPLAALLDRFILRPTRHGLPTEGKTRRTVEFRSGQVEIWTHGAGPAGRVPDLFVLKIPGAGGRAERATDHPLNVWPDLSGAIWTLNPPGYGGSSGRASLQTLAAASRAAFDEIQREAGGMPILVTGSSLGGAAALYLAATCPVAGVLVRNAPPLRETIRGRFGRWGIRWAVDLLARQVPDELCAVRNARSATAPAAFVVSARDRTVPAEYQQAIIDAYAGEKRVLVLPEADHHDPLTEANQAPYAELLTWLRERMA
jgi:uncharacterized protein